MLHHEDLWKAIDTLATSNGFSTSGLAKQAGLDPTIFNKSKRVSADGRERWPTMESISKILTTTNTSIGRFSSIIHDKSGKGDRFNLPFIKMNNLQQKKGFITPNGQVKLDERMPFFESTNIDSSSFGVKIIDDLYAPTFEKNSTIIVTTSGGVRKNDLAVIAMNTGENIIARILKISSHMVEIQSLRNKRKKVDLIPNKNILWTARILYKEII